MTLRPAFWNLPLADLTAPEWEALCDGCGKCCLNKLEDEETGEIAYTRVACRLFDGATCRCADYAGRLGIVPECIVLSPATLPDATRWLPATCAYKRRHLNQPLPRWHYLRSGDPQAVHRLRGAIRGRTVSETRVPEDTWEDHLIHVEI
jgi:uncharacterized cysteine cluster protein YcgN (CxxCxxCC family)